MPGFTPTRSSFANPLRLSELVRPFAIGSGAERIDTGILGIAGKVFLDKQTRRRIAPEFLNSLTLVTGMGGYCLFEKLIRDWLAGTFNNLIRLFTLSEEFDKTLQPSTKAEYRRMLTKAEGEFGDMPIAALDDPRA